jgi:hypothetical protein
MQHICHVSIIWICDWFILGTVLFRQGKDGHRFGRLLFFSNGFEKRIAKNPICFCCSVQPSNAVIKGLFIN